MLSPGKIFLLNSRLIKPTAYSPCPNRHFQLDIPKTDLWAFLKNHALSTVFPSRSMVVPAFQLEIGPDSWTLLFPSHTTPPLSPSPNPAGSTFTLYSRTIFYHLHCAHLSKPPSLLPESGNSVLSGVTIPPLSHHGLFLTQQPERYFQDMSVHVTFSCRTLQKFPVPLIVRAKDFTVPDNAHQILIYSYSDLISYSIALLVPRWHPRYFFFTSAMILPHSSHHMPSVCPPRPTLHPSEPRFITWKDGLSDECSVLSRSLFPGGSGQRVTLRSEEGETKVRSESFLSLLSAASFLQGRYSTASLSLRSQPQSSRL